MTDFLERLDQFWAAEFPGCDPVAFVLKTACRDRWVRFHSLPGSKRYPESEAEYQVVLQRHNTVIDEITAEDPEVILVTAAYSDDERTVERAPELIDLDPNARAWRCIPMHDTEDDSDDPTYWHLSASRWDWTGGILDSLLRMVADDRIANVMLIGVRSGFVYHPYDGGADVIFRTTQDRDELRDTHRDWLSDLPSGM